MFSEEELRQAAIEANKVIMSTLPEPEECTHEFSPKFERKIRKLVRKTDHPVRYRLRQTAWAALLVLVLGTVGFQCLGEDVQAKVVGWVHEQYETLVHFFFAGSASGTPAEDVDYRPTWIPEGFEEVDVKETPTGKMIIYSDGSELWIRFRYSWDIADSNLYVPEGSMRSKDVKVNASDAKVYWPIKGEREPYIVWKNSDETVVFFISGDLTEKEFIEMAESVK